MSQYQRKVLYLISLMMMVTSSLCYTDQSQQGIRTLSSLTKMESRSLESVYPFLDFSDNRFESGVQDIVECSGPKRSSEVSKILLSKGHIKINETGENCFPIISVKSPLATFDGVESIKEFEILSYGNEDLVCLSKSRFSDIDKSFCSDQCLNPNLHSKNCDGTSDYCLTNECNKRYPCFCFLAKLSSIYIMKSGNLSCFMKSFELVKSFLCPKTESILRRERSLIAIEIPDFRILMKEINSDLEISAIPAYQDIVTVTISSLMPKFSYSAQTNLPSRIPISPSMRMSLEKVDVIISHQNTVLARETKFLEAFTDCDEISRMSTISKIQNPTCFYLVLKAQALTLESMRSVLIVMLVVTILLKIRQGIALINYFFLRPLRWLISRILHLRIRKKNLKPLIPVSRLDLETRRLKPKVRYLNSTSEQEEPKRSILRKLLIFLFLTKPSEACSLNSLIPISMSNCEMLQDKEVCSTQLDVTLSISQLGGTACFTLLDLSQNFNPLYLEVEYDSLTCHFYTEELYCTSDWKSSVFKVSACNSDCGKMTSPQDYNPFSSIPENWFNDLGETLCKTSPGCAANGCFSCKNQAAAIRWVIKKTGADYSISNIYKKICKPKIKVVVKGSDGEILSKTAVADLEPGIKVSLNPNLTVSLVGRFQGTDLQLYDRFLIRNLQTDETYLSKVVSEFKKPKSYIIGDMQYLCKDRNHLNHEIIFFERSSVSCRAESWFQDCAFPTQGLKELSQSLELPNTILGKVVSENSSIITIKETETEPIMLFLHSERPLKVSRTLGSVCPELTIISNSGFRSSVKGVRVVIKAKSNCSPGVAFVSFTPEQNLHIQTPSLKLLESEHTFRIIGLSNEERITGILSLSSDDGRTSSVRLDFTLEEDPDKQMNNSYSQPDEEESIVIKENISNIMISAMLGVASVLGGVLSWLTNSLFGWIVTMIVIIAFCYFSFNWFILKKKRD